jgi:phosphopantothenoylcysteine synthetase/decarboxylase
MTKTILITSGPTREYIDPVRFISNSSSGKMGKAIVEAALKKGFNVIIVKGPSEEIKISKQCKIIDVISAKQMFDAVKINLKFADIFIGVAAVADYAPVSFSKIKIKKNKNILNLKLKKTADIIECVSNHKGNKIVIGFALESDNILEYATKKLKEKKLDMIIANGVNTISSEKSNPYLIFSDGKKKKLKSAKKQYIAKEIINEIIKIKSYKTCKNSN